MARRYVIALLTATTVALAWTTSGSAGVAAGIEQPKVLVIGVDGVGYQNLIGTNTPNIDALVAGGSLERAPIYAPPFSATVSGPGWATIASGVWPDRHQLYGNTGSRGRIKRFPDFLTRMEREQPSLDTLLVSDWPSINRPVDVGPIFTTEIDDRRNVNAQANGGYKRADGVVTDRAADALANDDVDAAFVYLGSPDVVAHKNGYGPEYDLAIRRADARVGELIAAIESRETFVAEDWLVMVTTDHGHVPQGGHGGGSVPERSSWIAAAGGDVPAGGFHVAPRITDVAVTALDHLGVGPTSPRMDGRNLGGGPGQDPFEEVEAELEPAADEDLPADVLGWTHETPAGWSIDNSRMPAGGVEEWRGWSFTNDDFWTQAAPGQQREAFVRSRGVIAVADTDEWDDAAHDDAPFDSTLISSPYDITGAHTVTIKFASHYRQSGDQKGTLAVSLDGGPPSTILRYGPGRLTRNAGGGYLAKIERVGFLAPSGAEEMRLLFRLFNGTNDWYRAIDDLRVGVVPP